MKFLQIVCLSVLAAVVYGVVHDQITIRICPEYFTVAHPRLIETNSLTLLALLWGVIATWWVGLPLGVLLGIATYAGSWPQLRLRAVAYMIAILVCVIGTLAGIAGVIAYAAECGQVFRDFASDLAGKIDRSMHNRFMIAWTMHVTSYCAGALGALVLAIIMLRKRVALAMQERVSTRHAG